MRLIRCHIENFGKLQDCSFEFTQGNNIFCRENGWGKSTFAAFIRVMFYGFEGDNKRKDLENERKRYQPWQGGNYGGQLTFQVHGKSYTVVRLFRDKKANDLFELRDTNTNLICHDYSEQLGEELFQINRESFLRTIFIGQNDCTTHATDSIHAKISNLAENQNDLNCYQSANQAFVDILNKMNPRRKSGLLHQMYEKKTTLEKSVSDGSKVNATLCQYQELLEQQRKELENVKKQQASILEQQKTVSRYQDASSKKEAYQQLCEDYEEKKEASSKAQRKFPKRIPTEDEMKKSFEIGKAMETANQAFEIYQLDGQEEKRYETLKAIFQQKPPSQHILDDIIEKNKKLLALRTEISAAQLSEDEQEKLEKYQSDFSGTTTPSAQVSKWIQSLEERNSKKHSLHAKQAALDALRETIQIQKQKTAKKLTAYLAMGAVVLLIGILLCQSFLKIGIFMVLIGMALVGRGMMQRNSKRTMSKSQNQEKLVKLEQEIQNDQIFIQNIDEKLLLYLKDHGEAVEEATMAECLQKLLTHAIVYENLMGKAQKANQNNREKDCAALSHTINEFLLQYGYQVKEADYTDALNQLKAEKEEYRLLQEKKGKCVTAKQEYEKMRQVLSEQMQEFGLQPEANLQDQVRQIWNDLLVYQNCQESFENAFNKKQRFEQENEMQMLLYDLPSEQWMSLEQLNEQSVQLDEKRKEIRNQITVYETQIDALQEEYDHWIEKKACLLQLKEQIQMQELKYSRVIKTQELLTKAKESLTSKYMEPLFTRFSKYYEQIEHAGAKQYQIDANTNIMIEKEGIQRNTGYLSIGYQDLIGFCMRISFVDAMYQEEKPFLILDDPFVNWDPKKVIAGKKLLMEIAKQYQILYFTCHDIRA